MKSGTSSSKLFLELFKKQIWVFALSCFGYFCVGPVLFLMRIGEWEAGSRFGMTPGRADMTAMFLRMVQAGADGGETMMVPFILGTLALGVVAAWNGFSYLHARGRVDLYHSLPVKREKLFLIQVLICAADYIIPALMWFVLSCVVAGVKNVFILQTGAALACDWLLGLIFCLYAFAIASLAMMLTGRLLTGILGTAVFFFLNILAGAIVTGFQSLFYNTMIGVRTDLFSGIGPDVLSPLHLTFRAFWSWHGGDGWTAALTAAAAALILLAVSLLIYKKRPSEAAGKAMAFFGAGEIIKVVLTVTAALAFGLFFGEATGESSDFWLIFGLLLGFVFIYALIQMIYTLDIRKCFAGRAAFITGLLITFGITAFCRFDLAGYDRYLPAQDQIEAIAVSVDNQVCCMSDSNMYEEARLEHAAMPCDDETYAVLSRFVSGNMIYHKTNVENEEGVWKQVRVRLKNGKTYRRGYTMYRSDVEQELLTLYGRKEYKEATWPMLAAGEEQLLGMRVYCNAKLLSDDDYYGHSMTDGEGRVLDPDDARTLLAALQEDFETVPPDVFLREMPYAMIQCQMDLSGAGFGENPAWEEPVYGMAGPGQKVWTASVPVFPSFKETGKVLKALEIEPVQNPDAEDVTKIEIWEDDEETGAETVTTVTDTAKIREILGGFTLCCSVPYTRGGSYASSWTAKRPMAALYVKTKGGEEILCSGWM